MTDREFEFGLQIFGAPTPQRLWDQARAAEDAGFDALLVSDHVAEGLLAPIATLGALAAVTTRVRVGSLVLNNDFRHPALLAREAATLDFLTDGRFDLGLGAGHSFPEYSEIGIPFDSAAERTARLGEAVSILRQLFDGCTVTFPGEHYQLTDHKLFPPSRPRLIVGGNGDSVLRSAGMYADVVNLTGFGRTLADGQTHEAQWRAAQIDRKVRIVREAAAGRAVIPILSALVQHVEVTADRKSAIEAVAKRRAADPTPMFDAPYMLVGTVGQIVEQIHTARVRWGISSYVVRDAGAAAPIIAAL